MTATEDKKPQTVPVDDDNDVDDSDEEGVPEIAAADGQSGQSPHRIPDILPIS